MYRFPVLSLMFVFVSQASANTSVWDDAKRAAYQVTGKITSIATNETEILIRISDGQTTETYKVCSSYPGGDGLNLVESERMKSIREAFRHGETIKASYNGPFDRCLSSIELSLNPEKIVKGEAIKPVNAMGSADRQRSNSNL